jgi:hypothetical protein
LAFYNEYFRSATCYGNLDRTFEIGAQEAKLHGIPVIDALHLAAANLCRCGLFVTTEKPTKSLFKTKLVPVVSIAEIEPAAHAKEYTRLNRLLNQP